MLKIVKENNPPKIAVVASLFPTVSETFVLNHITGLIDVGYVVDIYAFGVEHCDYPGHVQLADYDLIEKTTYLPTTLVEGSDEACNFIRQGYRVVHCHFGEIAERLSFLQPLMPKTLFFVTFHGRDLRIPIESGTNPYVNTYRCFDGIIAICDYNRRRLLEIGCPADKIINLPNSVNTQKFATMAKVKESTFRIITVARLHRTKNISFALQVLNKLKESYDEISYTLIGHGELLENIQSMVVEYGLVNHVTLLGQCPQEEVIRQLALADVFFLPSQAEASPICLLEAQACGLPVLSTRVGGTAELIEQGVTGYCIEVNDIRAACDTLLHFIRTPGLTVSMGKKARQFIVDNHDYRKRMRQLCDIYQIRSSPRVSVIIPTYNRSNLIGRAIESVLHQSYQNFELLIIDDGSSDDTASVVQAYIDRNSATIQYFHIQKNNVSVARNVGIRLARGEYLAFLDSDDYWHPEKLRKQITLLDSYPHIGLVHTDCQTLFTNTHVPVNMVCFPPTLSKNSDGILGGDSTVRMTVMVRKQLIEKAGGFDETYFTTQDIEMWIRLAKITEIALIGEILVYIRRHGSHLSSHNPAQKYRDRIRLAKKLIKDDHPSICGATWNRYLIRNRYGLAREIYKKGRYKNAMIYLVSSLRTDVLIGRVVFERNDRFFDRLSKLVEPYLILSKILLKDVRQ